ncbi:MAG: DUF4391 domain-containing protein [Burkholderiales bacterium]|nr:DUF4391 domain-containing protein [Burkholderiales bacterium]
MPLAPALFAWPPQAAVGRVVPKNKVYVHARPSPALRARFVAQVEQIVWAFKLAPETVNLPAAPEVPEIELFRIAQKTPELDLDVLRCIDRAIPFPILFELQHAGRSRGVAAYKRPAEGKATQWVPGEYFVTPWQPDEATRAGLPVALDLGGLYGELIRAHMPLPARPGESLRAQVERLALLREAEAAARKLAARLATEPQFNRKVELNAQLRTIRTRLESLSR